MNVQYIIKNGLYLPFISILMYFIVGDIYLPTFFLLKSFSVSYFMNFYDLYENPEWVKWKHMIRLTDTGHIASLLFYYDKSFVPLVHNVHFIITFAYHSTKILLGLKEAVEVENKEICSYVQDLHEFANHSIHYILVSHYIMNNQKDYCLFTDSSITLTYIWIYTWLFCIYIPWVYFTNDYLYSILEPKTPMKTRLSVILFVHCLVSVSNQVGSYLEGC